MSATNNVPSKNCDDHSFLGALSCGSGVASDLEGQTAYTLLTALVAASASFGIQFLIFAILRLRLTSIYRPRSYLVPEKERVPPPPPGLISWLEPLFTTPNLTFIQKCGLDAYFFLRYLRMLLKIFLPLAVLILPILLPINNYSGNNAGLDRLSISNISHKYTRDRLWAPLILAIVVILWVCYVVYAELRGYIRIRQAFLTSPQHRLRASATTVLVTGIPRKWLTMEALNGLYDVFPGGVRNIWINRNFDELAEKVDYRNKLAESLEDAETKLIQMCRKKHEEREEKRRKEEGKKKKTKEQRQREQAAADADAQALAQGDGISAGDQHDTPHGLDEALQEAEEAEDKRQENEHQHHKRTKRFGVLGDGIDVLGQGFDTIGRGVGKLGRGLADDVDAGIHKAVDDFDQRNAGKGFVMDDDLYRPRSDLSPGGAPPTPPPKTPHEERVARFPNAQVNQFPETRRTDLTPNNGQIQRTVMEVPDAAKDSDASPASEKGRRPPSIRVNKPSIESSQRSPFWIDGVLHLQQDSHPRWKFWKNSDRSIALPSPRPHTAEDDEFPLNATRSNTSSSASKKSDQATGDKWTDKLMFWKSKEEEVEESYPNAFNADWDEDQDGDAYWRRYLEPKERETIRVPIFSPTWCPSLPLIGKKVDRIYWNRRELARLNLEIERDQAHPEKFPHMNSAFIQFNHQVAAHMACQSVSHHIPQNMAPRLVEVSPEDVLWSNMSIVWWERYLRTGVVLIIAAGLIILYAIPVTIASLLSKLSTLARLKPLHWITKIPTVILTAVQGVLGPAFLGFILTLIPIIFRLLVQQQGVPTGTTRELGVQQWYFTFLFIQVFLVVSIAGGITALITAVANNPASVVSALGMELPKASDYFFYYLLVQALSSSASSLLQVGSLVGWFILGPLMDSTAREKWRRQTTLQNVTWGSFYPPFTNFAVIGLVYSVIAPLILVFMLIIMSLFWIVYRYNALYVYQFRNDTGGLLFPTAVNQLFVGLYTMELCLIGFFFVAKDASQGPAAIPEGIIMILALIFTALYQWLLNGAFNPLFRYLPITLEDEAVIRDEQFARAQASRFAPLVPQENAGDEHDIEDALQEREQREAEYEEKAAERERQDIAERRRGSHLGADVKTAASARDVSPRPSNNDRLSVAQPNWHTDRWRRTSAASHIPAADMAKLRKLTRPLRRATPAAADENPAPNKDVEAQQNTVGDVLFSGFADELEDLTPEERDLLVRYAFQHAALRAKRPVVWIPRDRLGVSDDEIKRAKRMSTVEVEDEERGGKIEKTNIWMSNEGTALDGKGKVVFRRSPPDFSNVDLIAL